MRAGWILVLAAAAMAEDAAPAHEEPPATEPPAQDGWENSDVYQNAPLEKTCKQDIEKFCHGIPMGNDRVRRCLQEHKYDADMSAECEQVLVEDEEHLAHQGALIDLGLCVNDIVAHPEMHCAANDNDNNKMKMIQCLVDNQDTLTDPLCKAEIFHAIKEQATDFRFDPDLHEDCHDDQKRLCGNIRPGQGRVHKCLRIHFTALSEKCLHAEFEEAIAEAQDVRLKPQIYFACQSAIEQFCDDVLTGGGKVVECLRQHMEDNQVHALCQQAVLEDAEIAARDIELNPALFEHCKADVENLCDKVFKTHDNHDHDKHKHNGEVIQCLEDHLDDVKSEQCFDQVIIQMEQASSNIHLAPEVDSACNDDIEKFCPDVTAGKGRVHQCLRDKFGQLSDECLEAEFQEEQREARDARLKVVLRPCTNEFKKFCADVEFGEGRVVECMQDKREDPEMSAECKTAVLRDMIISADDYKLKPLLFDACKDDAVHFCRHVIGKATGTPLNNGHVIECLIEHVKELKGHDCYRHVFREMSNEADDIRLDPGVAEYCYDDINHYCRGVTPGKGRMHECLRDHMESLSEPCKNAEFEQQKRENTDVRLQPQIKRECAKELKELCADESEDHQMDCLFGQMGSDKVSEECETALMADMHDMERNFKINPELESACKDEVAKWCPQKAPADSNVRTTMPDGETITCLIDHRHDIDEHSACADEVKMMIEMRELNIDLDPEVENDCKEDVQKFCAHVEPGEGRVLHCLQEHMSSLSPKCRRDEWEDTKMRYEDIDNMPNVRNACQRELKEFCPHVHDDEALSCLLNLSLFDEEHIEDGKFNKKCRDEVMKMGELEERNIQEEPGFLEACTEAAKKFCPTEYGQTGENRQLGELIHCLAQNYEEITEQECRTHVFSTIKMDEEDIEMDAFEQSVCKSDEELFCKHVKPGDGRMHDCLREHMQEISKACREAEFEMEQLEQIDVRLNPHLRKHCEHEYLIFCESNVEKSQDGDTDGLACLLEHFDDVELSSECREALEENREEVATDVRLRPKLFKRCHDDEVTLCDFSDEKDDTIMHGKIQNCMVEQYTEIKDPLCVKDVFAMALEQLRIPTAMPMFLESCGKDIKKLCKSSTRGSPVIKCLSDNRFKASTACKRVVEAFDRRLVLKKRYDSMHGNKATQTQSGIVLTGNLALLAIFCLVIVSSVLSYWLFKKISNPKKSYTVMVGGKGARRH